MYRCFACDVPAQSDCNCACFTQMERPENYEQKIATANNARINIATGEDVVLFPEMAEEAV